MKPVTGVRSVKSYRGLFHEWKKRPKNALALDKMLDAQGNRCNICHELIATFETLRFFRINGVELLATVDHIVPVTRGGWHTLDNLQWLCMRCNASKGNR